MVYRYVMSSLSKTRVPGGTTIEFGYVFAAKGIKPVQAKNEKSGVNGSALFLFWSIWSWISSVEFFSFGWSLMHWNFCWYNLLSSQYKVHTRSMPSKCTLELRKILQINWNRCPFKAFQVHFHGEASLYLPLSLENLQPFAGLHRWSAVVCPPTFLPLRFLYQQPLLEPWGQPAAQQMDHVWWHAHLLTQKCLPF